MRSQKHPIIYGKVRWVRVLLAAIVLGVLYTWIFSGSAKGAFGGSILLIPALVFLSWAVRRPRYDTNSKGRHGLLNAAKRPPPDNR